MSQGCSWPTRLIAPTKYPLATACAGCSNFQRYSESPATVADGLKTISAPFNPSARAPSGKWRSYERETPMRAEAVSKTGEPMFTRQKKKIFLKTGLTCGKGFLRYLPG